MFRHTISELKEALVCLQAGQVTLRYPFQPHPAEGEFRGLPAVEASRCIGCGACANACPARVISLEDIEGYRLVKFELGRCTYCASCRDACPQEAISMSPMFETATGAAADLVISLRLKLAYCRVCGAPLGTRRALEWVQSALSETGEYPGEMIKGLEMCLPCKRRQALTTAILLEEVAA